MSAGRAFWARVGWRSMLLGAACALLMLLALFLRDPVWSDRVPRLLALWFVGGMSGAIGASVLVFLAARWPGAIWATWFRRVAFLPCFLAATALLFAVQSISQADLWSSPYHSWMMLGWIGMQGVALFFYSISLFMLPWMAPAMLLFGLALLPTPPRGDDG